MFGLAHDDKILGAIVAPDLVVMVNMSAVWQWSSVDSFGNEDMFMDMPVSCLRVTGHVDPDVSLGVEISSALPPLTPFSGAGLVGAGSGAVLAGLTTPRVFGLGRPYLEIVPTPLALEGDLSHNSVDVLSAHDSSLDSYDADRTITQALRLPACC